MKIISKFKDYYDSGMAFGQDDGLVYVRQMQEFEISVHRGRSSAYAVNAADSDKNALALELYQRLKVLGFREDIGETMGVLFAGKFYFGIRVPGYGKPTQYFWDASKTIEYVSTLDQPLSRWRKNPTAQEIIRWFNRSSNTVPQDLLDLCNEHKIVCAIADPYRIGTAMLTINPILRPLGFIRVLEPFQAMQEISMFLGNIASKDDTPIKVSDADRVTQYGFDKWSFRRLPTKHS